MSKKELSFPEFVLHDLTTESRNVIFSKFLKGITEYKLLSPHDKIAVCISGGKDSMVMALCFKALARHSEIPFEVKYLVMDPGYDEPNRKRIEENCEKLEIPAYFYKTDIFAVNDQVEGSPCYLCAKMRRGALYRIAKSLGCNKIALGHHYDDAITTTLMNILSAGSFQTMVPKLPSDHYEGMELIRPLYFVRENDIIEFSKKHGLEFIACACRLTASLSKEEKEKISSRRALTKELIKKLMEVYSPAVEANLFIAPTNVNLAMVMGYKDESGKHSFLDDYEEKKKALSKYIRENGIEEASVKKAEDEHREWEIVKPKDFD